MFVVVGQMAAGKAFVSCVEMPNSGRGLVLTGNLGDLVMDFGSGRFSCDSHDDTRHFFRLMNLLMVLIKYTRAATAVRDIPVNVRNNTNHIWDSRVNSWKCFSVLIVISPLQPSIAVSRASCQPTVLLCPLCRL